MISCMRVVRYLHVHSNTIHTEDATTKHIIPPAYTDSVFQLWLQEIPTSYNHAGPASSWKVLKLKRYTISIKWPWRNPFYFPVKAGEGYYAINKPCIWKKNSCAFIHSNCASSSLWLRRTQTSEWPGWLPLILHLRNHFYRFFVTWQIVVFVRTYWHQEGWGLRA